MEHILRIHLIILTTGLLIRTAEAAGAGALFVPAGATDPFHPTVVQASMGAVFHLNIISNTDSAEVIAAARDKGIEIIGTSVGNSVSVEDWLESDPSDFLIVLGNEGSGLEHEIVQLMDRNITLPMWGNTESLNVAVSAGIILYLARIAGQTS